MAESFHEITDIVPAGASKVCHALAVPDDAYSKLVSSCRTWFSEHEKIEANYARAHQTNNEKLLSQFVNVSDFEANRESLRSALLEVIQGTDSSDIIRAKLQDFRRVIQRRVGELCSRINYVQLMMYLFFRALFLCSTGYNI